jgi:hypothetical protein
MNESRQMPVKRVSAPARWLLPSIGSFCLLLVLYLLVTSSWRFLLDSDTGWHIRAGDLIWQTRTAPRRDVFSFTLPGGEWFAWEWLAEALMSAAHQARGLAGVVGAAILLLCLSYAALYRVMLARGADALVACALTVFAALASIVHWLARPHLLSIALMLAWCVLVESYRRRRSRWIYAAPLLLALWANLHGAFVATFVMLAIYAGGELIEFALRRDLSGQLSPLWRSRELRAALRTYALVGGLSLIATLATPYGFKLYRHLWRYLNDTELLSSIQEFQSPNFHLTDGKLIEVLLLLGALAAAQAVRQRRFVEVGLLLLWAHLTIQSERHVTLAVVVMTPIIAEQLSALLREAAAAAARGQGEAARWWRALAGWYRGIIAIDRQLTGALVYTSVFAFVLVVTGSRWADRLLSPRFDAKRFPVAAANFIAEAKLSGNMYAHDQYGGYLIYRLYPQVRVFADGRSDFYRQAPVLDDMEKISNVKPAWAQLLDRYEVRWMLLRRDEPLAQIAELSGHWVSAYRDDTAQVLVRTNPTDTQALQLEAQHRHPDAVE